MNILVCLCILLYCRIWCLIIWAHVLLYYFWEDGFFLFSVFLPFIISFELKFFLYYFYFVGSCYVATLSMGPIDDISLEIFSSSNFISYFFNFFNNDFCIIKIFIILFFMIAAIPYHHL